MRLVISWQTGLGWARALTTTSNIRALCLGTETSKVNDLHSYPRFSIHSVMGDTPLSTLPRNCLCLYQHRDNKGRYIFIAILFELLQPVYYLHEFARVLTKGGSRCALHLMYYAFCFFVILAMMTMFLSQAITGRDGFSVRTEQFLMIGSG